MFFTSSVLLLCVVGALGAPQTPFRGRLPHLPARPSHHFEIINGNKTSVSKYPYIAALFHKGQHSGSAVIVNNEWLVTLCGLIDYIPPEQLTFRVGSDDYDKEGQVLQASKTVIHPKCDPLGYDYGIAVIKLAKPIKFGKKVKAVKALATTKLQPGSQGYLAGWGAYDRNQAVSESLLEAKVTVYDTKECKKTYLNTVTPRVFCTFDENVSPCGPDYGDPLVVDDVLYGLFLGGFDCLPGGYPVVYTNIAALYQWVQDTIKSG